MAKDNLEIEVKLYVPDLDAVAQRLEALGAVLTAPRVYERNIRYENAAGTLARSDVVLRLRQDTRARLTYKGAAQAAQHAAEGIRARFEAEVEVSDFDTMDLILRQLGFTPHMIYEKYRTTYTLDNAEIVLDEMPYGNFVEIEGASAETIESLLSRLALTQFRRYGESYALLFEFVKRSMNLDFNDLTFANFAGISVPQSAFSQL